VADGHKFLVVTRSDPKTLQSVEKRNFTYPTCLWSPRWGWSHRNFVDVFCIVKLESLDLIVRRCFRDPKFSRFCRIPACYRRTDWQTDTGSTLTRVQNPRRDKPNVGALRQGKPRVAYVCKLKSTQLNFIMTYLQLNRWTAELLNVYNSLGLNMCDNEIQQNAILAYCNSSRLILRSFWTPTHTLNYLTPKYMGFRNP